MLVAKCFAAIFEIDSQSKETFWYRVLNEFNRLNFQKRTKDMLSSKWNTLNHNCQKFNAIYKRCSCLTKSGENEVDLMKRVRAIYGDEKKITRLITKMLEQLCKLIQMGRIPAPVDLTEGEHVPAVNTEELFGPDARPHPP
nr:myb-like domain, Myb/SANT-like DNA-binding domain protein [Tanacetum cinerariifolium]